MSLLAGVCIVSMPVLARSVEESVPAESDQAADENAADQLAAVLCMQVKALPTETAAEQYEAALIFELSQSAKPDTVRYSALSRLAQNCALSDRMAVGARQALVALARNGSDGTAALTNGGGGGSSQYSAFSNPLIQMGGGSANYSSSSSL